jgi:hypothetical protein
MEADMKRILPFLPLLLVAGCTAEPPAAASESDAARLAAALEGRTAGPPVSCVNQQSLRGNRSIGEGAILFDGPGGTIYVNRPPAGCPRIDAGRTLVTRTTTGQLCRGDIVNVVDVPSGTEYGSCGLGDFVPYNRD